VKRERHGRGTGGAPLVWLGWGGSGVEGEWFRASRTAWWLSVGLAAAASAMTGGRGRRGRVGRAGPKGRVGRARLAGRFRKRNEKKIETGWAGRGFLGQNQIRPPEENKNCF
jgi:hypothetical protein